MHGFVAQSMPTGLFDMAFSLALLAGALLFIGGLISFAVFGYRSIKGEGMKDTGDEAPGDDGELTEGDSDDEWEFY